MKKRIISLLLIVCLVVSMLPVSAMAATTPAGSAQGQFDDVKASDWFYEAVRYARANGLMNGTSSKIFSPHGTLTRGMFVTMLGRLAGVDPTNYAGQSEFSDVAATAYYAPYVAWAAKYGIAAGTGNGRFSPEALVTRQQMALFFVRYFERFGVKCASAGVTTEPADMDSVAPYAKDAVLKLWQLGLLGGDGKNFDPNGNATRAQAATLCMRADKNVETWYCEPGVASTRQRIEPAAEEIDAAADPVKKPTGGGSRTTYYNVQFGTVDGTDTNGLTLPDAGVFVSGRKLSTIPTPYQQGHVFLGWYYDAAMTKAASGDDTISGNMTLYAKMGEVNSPAVQETPNYVTVMDVPASYTFSIQGYDEGCVRSFINITANNEEVPFTAPGGQVQAALAQGQTYRVTLEEDSPAVFVLNGAAQDASVRELNIVTVKDEVDALALNSDVRYVPVSAVSGMSGTLLDGLFHASTATQSTAQNQSSGSFTYTAGSLNVGDVAAIYDGLIPSERTNATLGTAEDGAIAYVEITAKDGDTYTYQSADSEDVLFTPDVLPISRADMTAAGANTFTIPAEALDFASSDHAEYFALAGLDSQTTADVGDYIVFYSGALDSGTQDGYGCITDISEANGTYTITYKTVSQADVLASMDLYSTRDQEIELTEAEIQAITSDIERQAMDSGFADEAAAYLTDLALQTDGFQELSDAAAVQAATWSARNVRSNAQKGQVATYASTQKAEIKNLNVQATMAAGKCLQHFDGRTGVRVELSVTFNVEVGDKLEITVQAIFEQEVLLSVNASGGAIWKWKWIIPYIYDYRLNANIDVGTYTGIGITATAKTVGEEDDAFDWKPVTGSGAESKILDIGKQITDLMEAKEEFLGEKLVDENGEEIEWAGTNGGGLADKYAAMMEDAEDSWVKLFEKEIFSQEGTVDLLHILCYGVSANFVVRANLYVTLGMTFSYSVARRYNFSIMLFHKQSTNETIDLEEANYNFDFYVMGTIGIRAGVELEVGVGLFSLKLDSIGITAEVGAYAQLWGYFYYHLSWSKSGGRESSCSGAMVIEIGLYLTITFKAQLFSSDKLTYQPTLYDNQWPLLTIGSVDNVYDFAYDDDDALLDMNIYGVRSFTLPTALFEMNYMDMKSGDLYGSDADDPNENPALSGYGDRATNYTVECSNPKFAYDAGTNTVSIDAGTSVAEECEITLTWKNGTLAFTSRPIQRTVKISWLDPANARFISFDACGGNGGKTLSAAVGDAVAQPAAPTKTGYDFAGWYKDQGLTQAFSCPATMPDYPQTAQGRGITVYAKWTPRHDTKYTVQHYLQSLNGSYTLLETATQVLEDGTTDAMTHVQALPFEHYTARPITQKTVAPNGSTVVRVYYTLDTHTVTFSYGALGSDNAPLTYTARYGATIYTPMLALGGYDFTGFTGLKGSSLVVTGDAAYTATWSPRSDTPFRVEHYVQRTETDGYLLPGGEDAIQYASGTTGAVIDIDQFMLSTKDAGLHFVRATVNGQQTSAPTIAADGKTVVKLYYDRASITVTLDTAGGNTIQPITKRYGAPLQLPTPVRVGYTFAGWFNGDTAFTQSTMPTESLTLTAHWTPNGDTAYKVETYLQNAAGSYTSAPTESQDMTGETDAAVTAPQPERAGYHIDTDAADAVLNSTIAADGSLVLKVYYARNTYTLTFRNSGDDDRSSTLRWGEAITAPELTKAGYTLSWTPELAGVMPQEDATYTAVWTANNDTPYIVEHYQQNADDDGYTLKDTQNLAGTTDTTATAAAQSYAHFTLNEHAAGAVPSGTITADGRLVLKLYYDRDTFTLTLNGNGGTVTGEAARTLRYGQTLGLENPEREDYGFDGWFTDADCTAKFSGSTMPAEDDLTLYAGWTAGAVSYTVQHYVMDTTGSYAVTPVTDNVSGTVDSQLALESLKKTGLGTAFTFEKATLDGVAVADTSVTIAKGMTVALYYSRAQYLLTWALGEGTAEDGYTSGSVYFDAPITAPVPTLTGHSYTWDTEPAATMPARDVTYTAQWTANEYTITFDTDGGSDVASITQAYGTEVSAPEAPGKTGYDFAGWDTEIPATMPAGDLAIKAQWTPQRYAITYVGVEDATFAAAQPTEHVYGTDTVIPAPTRVGFDFLGWKVNDNTEAEISLTLGGTDYTAAITLTATWRNSDVTLKFVTGVDGASIPDITVCYGDKADAPAAPEKPGYDFDGWYTASNEQFDFTAGVTQSQTLTAHWTAHPYTITYQLDGGVNDAANPATYTILDAFTFAAPSKTGYDFTGWTVATADGGTEAITQIAVGSTGDLVLTASWEVQTITITYHGNGGKVLIATGVGNHYDEVETLEVTLKYGEKYAPLSAQTARRQDEANTYRFLGWSKNPSATVQEEDPKYFSLNPQTESFDLYAVWDKPTERMYTVTWDTQGGSAIRDTKVAYNGTVVAPRDPTRSHGDDSKEWVFNGWYTDSACTTKAIFEEPIQGNTTFYAGWTEQTKQVTITFETYGGLVNGQSNIVRTADYGAAVSHWPDDPVLEGYTFTGWQIKSGIGNWFGERGSNTTFTKDTTLYAKYEYNGTKYNIWLAGTQVTDGNKDDIRKFDRLSTSCERGTASYDPATNTLTLDDYYFNQSNGYDLPYGNSANQLIRSVLYAEPGNNVDFKIVFKGSCEIISQYASASPSTIRYARCAIYMGNGNLILEGAYSDSILRLVAVAKGEYYSNTEDQNGHTAMGICLRHTENDGNVTINSGTVILKTEGRKDERCIQSIYGGKAGTVTFNGGELRIYTTNYHQFPMSCNIKAGENTRLTWQRLSDKAHTLEPGDSMYIYGYGHDSTDPNPHSTFTTEKVS